MVHGFSVAYWIAAGLLTVAAISAGVLVNARPQQHGGRPEGGSGTGDTGAGHADTIEDAVPVFAH
nr:hypothetical protein [Catenulispora rubra]